MFLLQLEISLLSVPCLRQISHLQWTLPKEVSVAVFSLSEELTAYFQGQSKGHHCRFWAAWSHQALKKVRKRLGQASKRWRFGPSLAAWRWLPWRLTHLELLTGISLKWRLISSVRERKWFLNTDKGSCISAKENSLKIPNRTCWLFFLMDRGPGRGKMPLHHWKLTAKSSVSQMTSSAGNVWIPGAPLQLWELCSPQEPPSAFVQGWMPC